MAAQDTCNFFLHTGTDLHLLMHRFLFVFPNFSAVSSRRRRALPILTAFF